MLSYTLAPMRLEIAVSAESIPLVTLKNADFWSIYSNMFGEHSRKYEWPTSCLTPIAQAPTNQQMASHWIGLSERYYT
jgi:hypothetical protein